MTYRMNGCCPGQGMGSYYTYGRGQVYGMSGIADTFNADAVWADAQLGGSVGTLQKAKQGCLNEPGADQSLCSHFDAQIGKANAAGNRAANAVREALRELGYSPGPNNQVWGPQDVNAWKAFTSKHGLPAGPGIVNKAGLDQMEVELQGTTTGLTKAGLTPLGWAAVALAAGAAGYALLSGRKKKKGATKPVPTGRAMVPMR